MTISLPSLPMPLSWRVPAVSGQVDGDAALTITAAGRTDLFVDPAGGEPNLTAQALLGTPPPGDFQLSARVRSRLAETFDAGVLLVWIDDRTWAKLCFEQSPQGVPMVVSVVTRGVSDDANAFIVDGDQVWLRVSRVNATWAFHASTDGAFWRFIRYFSLGGEQPAEALVGFEAQAPLGQGCEVSFEEITFRPGAPADLRDGT